MQVDCSHVKDDEAKLDNQVCLNDFGEVRAVLEEILSFGEVLEGT